MKKAKAMQLVKALRSGKFKQGHEHLKWIMSDGTYRHCCLGVACELSKAVRWANRSCDIETDTQSDIVLPIPVMKEFGFFEKTGARRDNLPIVIDNQAYRNLVAANDAGVPFPKIADYIEQNYKYL